MTAFRIPRKRLYESPFDVTGLRFLITGANGFVGSALCNETTQRGHNTRHAMRTNIAPAQTGVDIALIRDVGPHTNWSTALEKVDVIAHLAAKVHVRHELEADSPAAYKTVNTLGTLNLARQAADTGVRRFIFMSSLKVHGEISPANRPFTETDTPVTADAYAHSKLEAEQGLLALGRATGMEVVIIRSPLVYGPAVKANFGRLIRAVQSGRVLPLGGIHNRRSMVALDNLVDFTMLCGLHPAAANQVFLVSDGQDLSTPDLVRDLARAAGKAVHLPAVPPWMLRAGGYVLGQRSAIQRLCCNLQVDITKARTLLGWTPPVSVAEGLRRAVQGRGAG